MQALSLYIKRGVQLQRGPALSNKSKKLKGAREMDVYFSSVGHFGGSRQAVLYRDAASCIHVPCASRRVFSLTAETGRPCPRVVCRLAVSR